MKTKRTARSKDKRLCKSKCCGRKDKMAEEVKKLKKERTKAKSLFTRQANFVIRDASMMVQGELMAEFDKLSEYLKELFGSNDNYMAGLLSLAETKKDEEPYIEQQEEIDKTATEAEEKFKLVRETVQDNLWSRYGKQEMSAAILDAEESGQMANDFPVLGMNVEGYEVHMNLLEKRINAVAGTMLAWERWIPGEERRTLDERIKILKTMKNKLELRKVEFVTHRTAEATSGRSEAPPLIPTVANPIVRIKPTTLPIFTGDKREYHRWKKDWESLQKQGEPTGSTEVKKIQLLDSIDGRIARDLRLSTYTSAEDIFRVLSNRYGNKSLIAIEILEDLEKLPPVRGNQPRRVIDLIQTVEKALADLTDLGNTEAIKNPLVIKTIESKLPDFVKRDWLIFMMEPSNNVTTGNHFDMLLKFLQKQEGILERLEQLKVVDKQDQYPVKRSEKKFASTKTTKRELENACAVCGEGRHYNKLFFCRKFKALTVPEKKATLKKLGTCTKCLSWHSDGGGCKDTFLCRNKECKKGGSADHHYFLCPQNTKAGDEAFRKSSPSKTKLTDEQEEFLSELSPEMAERCKKAFTNGTRVGSSNKVPSPLLKKHRFSELPVILMLMEVTANAGQKIGTLIDLASDTNYITHKAADRLGLRSEKITLVLYGVSGMSMTVSTKRYLLRVRIKTPAGKERGHEMVCYGLDDIAKVHKEIEPERLCAFFPEVELDELKRPAEIELLISHREGRLAPQRVRVIGDLVLWEGPLGKTIGGAHPDLFEDVEMAAHRSKTHFVRSMRTAAVKYEELPEHPGPEKVPLFTATATTTRDFLEWWRWESIGASCEPKCGGCRCGNCQPGGKEMTLAEEKELEIIKQGLTYVKEDAHVSSPHWDAKYPWSEDPASLPNNKNAVQATFLRTERQLEREPEWKAAYTAQVHEMVERRAAVKLTEEMKDCWKGPVWYVSHLVAPNPHSVTTPVRLVWNSSQKFKGLSMNDILLKGPDVLNPIRTVLLHFRQGIYAALGDIKKMYNSVWLEDREMHLHRFLSRDHPEDDIEEFAITRVNIGDRPAGCIAQLAMRETAKLPTFTHLKEERRVLEEDSYVDDILTSHNSLETLVKITQGVEDILKTGGFYLKPWVWSGQSGRQKSTGGIQQENQNPRSKTIILYNQMRDEDNKALGVGYDTEEDKLYMLTSINFSKKRKKMRMGKNLTKDEVRPGTPNPLSRRELLSQVAGLYDPIGLVAPLKQKGAILVRKAFQETGGGSMTHETWDKPLSEGLREEAVKLFEEYANLSQIKFPRSLTPTDWKDQPVAITFSDGSDKTYGAVMYLRWDTTHGAEVRFVEAKAKLTPLDQKGDAVKAEICGAVFAARLRKYFERHSRMQVERWFHLVDSQTVLGAIQRDSYGYQTFFANRVGEIQKTAPIKDWWWIPGELNIADIITRGSTAEDLVEGSAWQNGPDFLKLPVEEWPIKSPGEVAAQARENVNKLQRKAFVAAVTRSQAKQNKVVQPPHKAHQDQVQSPVIEPVIEPVRNRRAPSGWVNKVVTIESYSTLQKLVDVVAWICRVVNTWMGKWKRNLPEKENLPGKENMREKRSKPVKEHLPVLTVAERRDALRDLFLSAQEGKTFPETSLNRLAVYRDTNGLLVCGGRVQMFTKDKTAVPILPFDSWISTLLAREAHNTNHEGIAGTLLKMRGKAWVVKGRRLAKRMVDNCVTCKKIKAKQCQQIMSDLPPERVNPAKPFEYTTVDLFGPYMVKDEVKKRVKIKAWGIAFCCMASRAIHADVVCDQSSEGFLLTYQRFTALRGHPRKIWSDPGTNFVGAKPALQDLYRYIDSINKTELEEKASKNGTEWFWKIHPADSPHRNGAAEAAVKLVKRALNNLAGDGIFTWSELQTFLFMAANVVNERPIDARVQSREDCVNYVSPNCLLLGRASPKGDSANFNFEGYAYKRLQSIQSEISKFWKKWCQLAGPNLFVRNKWHTKERNVAVGDIVWIADQNALRSQYKLGRVVNVNPDKKGIVRDANIRVFPSYPVSISKPAKEQSGLKIPATILHRDVRRLVVLLPIEDQRP